MKKVIISLCILIALLVTSGKSNAHCDTKDGPVVAAAIKAIQNNNVNYALIWVKPAFEKEIKEAFVSTMKVRVLSSDAQKLADNYFYETLVRLHRSGEGMAYTGVKPNGTPIDKKILAADKSILLGNLSPLKALVPENKFDELKKRFDKVMSLKLFDVNDLQAGRKYVEAYVQFFHFAEGEGDHNPKHTEEHGRET
jgi:hypothetical protein